MRCCGMSSNHMSKWYVIVIEVACPQRMGTTYQKNFLLYLLSIVYALYAGRRSSQVEITGLSGRSSTFPAGLFLEPCQIRVPREASINSHLRCSKCVYSRNCQIKIGRYWMVPIMIVIILCGTQVPYSVPISIFISMHHSIFGNTQVSLPGSRISP